MFSIFSAAMYLQEADQMQGRSCTTVHKHVLALTQLKNILFSVDDLQSAIGKPLT
jgi:hypothetical protein